MHTRRLASFLLGGWMVGSLIVIFVAIHNDTGIDRLLETQVEPAAKLLDQVGRSNARALLRHQAGQLNERVLLRWEQVQIALGLALTGSLVFATHRRLMPILLASLMLVMVVFLHLAISPEIGWLERDIDFLPAGTLAAQVRRLSAMQVVYAATEAAKLVVGGLLAAYLFVFRGRGARLARTLQEVDAVDDPDHSHVDG